MPLTRKEYRYNKLHPNSKNNWRNKFLLLVQVHVEIAPRINEQRKALYEEFLGHDDKYIPENEDMLMSLLDKI